MCSAVEAEELPEDFLENKQTEYRVAMLDERTLKSLFDHGEHRPWVIWGKLIRKEIVQKIPFAEGRIYEDNAVVCQWLVEAGRIVDVEAQLYFYRINPNGTTKREYHIKHLDYLWALEEMISFFRRIGYFTVCRQHIRDYMCLVMDKIQTFSSNTSAESFALLRVVTQKRHKNFLRYALWLDPSKDADAWVLTKAFPKAMWLYWHLRALLNKRK